MKPIKKESSPDVQSSRGITATESNETAPNKEETGNEEPTGMNTGEEDKPSDQVVECLMLL